LEVTLTRDAGIVTIEVRDNGRGLVPVAADRAAQSGHFGIRGMHERMGLIGGTLAVTAAPDGGTRVRAAFPLGEEGGDRGH
jgi:signal transduction histidine kinase